MSKEKISKLSQASDKGSTKTESRDRERLDAEFQGIHLNRYAEIGLSLSGEDDIDKLLEMIVFEARDITQADAGTLYLINREGNHLDFVVLQNDTIGTRLGGKSGDMITLPPVPLYINGKANYDHVSSFVALTGDIVNVTDVYKSDEFDFSGPREYDRTSGYRSKSMLVIPLRDHENEITGVLQLLNAKNRETGEIMEFHDDLVSLVASLASQAAAALTRTELIQELKHLLDAFIQSIAGAIEEKSNYTGGHIARVARLAVKIAQKVNQAEQGPFQDVYFSRDELEELRIAAWLHDIGKITTPEHVIDKSTKLETIFDRMAMVRERFHLAIKSAEADYYRRKCQLLEQGETRLIPPVERMFHENIAALQNDLAFVEQCNQSSETMGRHDIARLESIGAKTFAYGGKIRPLLSGDEVSNLCVKKGTLNVRERKIIENHALVTYNMLKKLPFPKKMSRIPEFAGMHHEKLDGSGYPFGVSGKDMSLQARIMAVADIFEALTASDRPYKQPMPLSRALSILKEMKDDGHIDHDVYDLLLSSGLVEEYAAEEVMPEMVDMDLPKGRSALALLVVSGPEGMRPEWESLLEDYGFNMVVAKDADHGRSFAYKAQERRDPFTLAMVDRSLVQGDDYQALAEGFIRDVRLGLSRVIAFNATGGTDEDKVKQLGFAGLLERSASLETMLTQVCKVLNFEDCDTAPEAEAMKRMLSIRKNRGKKQGIVCQGPRILIADDSLNTRMLFRYYLQNTRYTADIAENGLKALERYAEIDFDLVFMDLGMPVMDGYAAIKAIRAWEREQGMDQKPVVAMTAHVTREDAKLRSMQGHDKLLVKPVTRQDFLALVDHYLA